MSALYLFMICPRLRHRCDMTSFCSKPTCHRGIHNNKTIPENSIPAFKAAIEAEHGIEFDVQFTKDHQLVVFHDDDLSRMCGINKKVIDLTYDELSEIRLLDTDEKIPTLKEVLDLIDGRVPIIIEMKNALSMIRELPCKLYEVMKDYHGEYSIESFNPMYVGKYRKFDKTVARGVLSLKFGKIDGKKHQQVLAVILENLLMNFIAKPDFIAYRYTDYKKLSFRLNRLLGATTVAWTIPENSDIHNKVKKYFDAYICDISSSDMLDNLLVERND